MNEMPIQSEVMMSEDILSKKKIQLYIDSYWNDPYRKEGRKNETWTYLTLDEYENKKWSLDLSAFKRVYMPEWLLKTFNEQSNMSSYIELQTYIWEELAWVIYWYSQEKEWLQKKLRLSNNEYQEVENFIWDPTYISYLAELFVWSNRRWMWISKNLLDEYIEKAFTKNLSWIITRTTTKKSYPMSSFLKRDFELLYTYKHDPRDSALFFKRFRW